MLNSVNRDNKKCLNGWWDFIPVYDSNAKREVPIDGWIEGKYLVPSIWTKSNQGVRKKGEEFYKSNRKCEFKDDEEFLFDAYHYPVEWSRTRSAWIKRTLNVGKIMPSSRYFLHFDAVAPRCSLFVNGRYICENNDASLPFDVDITEYLQEGINEIAVLVLDFERDNRGRTKTPSGNEFLCDYSGIWQDVYLIVRGDVYLNDITIRTSTRNKTIYVKFEITNTSNSVKEITVCSHIENWVKEATAGEGQKVFEFDDKNLIVGAGETASFEMTCKWDNAVWWYPENPKLYEVCTTIWEGTHVHDLSRERFGFRQVWIDGPNIMLNDYPVHLFSDWGHKATPYCHTKEWILKWFQMIKDGNMNHSRLHTHPHPKVYLELADEEGILITGETAIHGSGGDQAADSPEFWEAAKEHIKRFIKRDKNHPSIVIWSVENEMRWNGDSTGLTQQQLPKMKELFSSLDPTRPTYHEGDSSMWNEKTQDIISRHYGKDCAGLGWWDGKQPLHSGEMAIYHYLGPNNTVQLAGDRVWENYDEVDKMAAEDTRLVIESGRTVGVCSFGPWNISCHMNLRMDRELVELKYDDYTVPGIKPLYADPYTSEFNFWSLGKGYTPNHSFDIQANAFRPFAVIDRSLKPSYFAGSIFKRELFSVNDTSALVEGILRVRLQSKDFCIVDTCFNVNVSRGRVESNTIEVKIPEDVEDGVYDYSVVFEGRHGVIDKWSRSLKICRSQVDRNSGEILVNGRVAVFGAGYLRDKLNNLGIDCFYTQTLDTAALLDAKILIMEKNSVVPGSKQNVEVKAFVEKGGRLILMEQTDSLFPGMVIDDKPVLKAFIRTYDHEVIGKLSDNDFFSWGEDSYALMSGDSYIAYRMYRKGDGRLCQYLLDSGEGTFGSGDLEFTPLFESEEGKGLILACQLRLTDKMKDTPPAEKLFLNMLKRADTYEYREKACPLVIGDVEGVDLKQCVEAARQGSVVIVNNAEAEELEALSELLGMQLKACNNREEYQLVRVNDDPMVSGISNWDSCGVETYCYSGNCWGKLQNFRVCDTFIYSVEGLKPLFEAPTRSCLKELMVYGGKREVLRAYTVSKYLYDTKPERAIAIGYVEVEKGMVIFNQFNAPVQERDRFKRVHNRLLANMGVRFEGSLLDGDEVPVKNVYYSKGHPEQIYIYNGNVDGELYSQMVSYTVPSLERMAIAPMFNINGWEKVNSDQWGRWRAEDLNGNDEVFIYYRIKSQITRKNDETNLGIPNPEALTFMDIYGEGEVEITLNGDTIGRMDITGGIATVSDIALEMGFNHILLKWKPMSDQSTIQMKWRNIMRKPEIGFMFM